MKSTATRKGVFKKVVITGRNIHYVLGSKLDINRTNRTVDCVVLCDHAASDKIAPLVRKTEREQLSRDYRIMDGIFSEILEKSISASVG